MNEEAIKIGAIFNKHVWQYTSKRQKDGTYILTGLDFTRKIKKGDILDSFFPSAFFEVLEEPVWSDSTATFEGIYEKVDPKGIHYSVKCKYLQPIDRTKKP